MLNRGGSSLVSSYRREYVYDEEQLFCKCKKLVVRVTSWSESNPGRRYYICPDFQEVEGGCGYFKWYDPSMCDRAKQLLNQFRDSERKLNKENLALRRQISKEAGRLRNEESGSSVGTRLEVNFDGEMDSKRGYGGNRDKEVQLLKEEVVCTERIISRLKQQAKAEKRMKQMYKILLISSWFCMLWFILGLLMGQYVEKKLALP
ncbi:hypothetical protein PTKIN_Ptkin01aG0317700 [Pterospermum kingtungense]